MRMKMRNLWVACGIIAIMAPVFSAGAQDPAAMADQSRITLSGRVVDTDEDSFELDYGRGLVTVEMDSWSWYENDYPILVGDNVTVSGNIDNDGYEETSIEAGSVYVEDLDTYYYANPLDEEEAAFVMTPDDIDASLMQVRGEVKGIEGRELLLDTGTQTLRVDTGDMVYNPLDDKGYQKIEEGDRVLITGDMDADVFSEKRLEAYTVTKLVRDRGKNRGD